MFTHMMMFHLLTIHSCLECSIAILPQRTLYNKKQIHLLHFLTHDLTPSSMTDVTTDSVHVP
jgi:hypothetical protein